MFKSIQTNLRWSHWIHHSPHSIYKLATNYINFVRCHFCCLSMCNIYMNYFFCQTTKSSKSPTIAPSWIKLYCGYLTKFHKFMKGWLRFRRIALHHNAFILMKKLEIACKTEFFLQHGMLNLSIHHFISVKCQLLHFLQELLWYSITLSANGKAGVPKYDRYLNTNSPNIDKFVEL